MALVLRWTTRDWEWLCVFLAVEPTQRIVRHTDLLFGAAAVSWPSYAKRTGWMSVGQTSSRVAQLRPSLRKPKLSTLPSPKQCVYRKNYISWPSYQNCKKSRQQVESRVGHATNVGNQLEVAVGSILMRHCRREGERGGETLRRCRWKVSDWGQRRSRWKWRDSQLGQRRRICRGCQGSTD